MYYSYPCNSSVCLKLPPNKRLNVKTTLFKWSFCMQSSTFYITLPTFWGIVASEDPGSPELIDGGKAGVEAAWTFHVSFLVHSAVHASENGPPVLPHSIFRQVELAGAFLLQACALTFFQVFALLVFHSSTQRTQQGTNVEGLHGRQSVPPSFLSHLFFCCYLLGEWQRREKEKVVGARACSILQKLPQILPTPVQCGLADRPIQKWPLFLYLLGWPCDPATCPQQRHLEWAWASLLGDGKHMHGKVIPIALADAEPVLRHVNEAIPVYSCPAEPPAAPRHSMSSIEVSKVAQARRSAPPAQRRVGRNTPFVVLSH